MSAQLVPNPLSLTSLPTTARLSDGLTIEADVRLAGVASRFRRTLEAATGWRIGLETGGAGAGSSDSGSSGSGSLGSGSSGASGRTSIQLLLGRDPLMPSTDESYVLTAGDDNVSVRGASPAGVFYGLQTLRQLLPDDCWRAAPVSRVPRQPIVIEGVEVIDGAGHEWRGVHLDVARHYMPKDFILRLIDLIAAHKFNVLHLHLTDDQGWRVEIDRYPRLVEVGAWRRESSLGHLEEAAFDGRPHGGWYSKADLREIVAFAAERFVTVLPEIDMPGHMVAAIAAYPELGNGGEPREVMTAWGISEHVLNLDEPTIEFCTDVLEEVLEIFPSRYIHVGGDECPTKEWEASPSARALMEREGYSSVRQLQGWFTARIGAWLAERDRILVGWDEILEGGAPPGAVVMSWRGEGGGIDAATAGHDVVMAPEEWCYFDWSYARSRFEPRGIRPATSVDKVYAYSPVPPALAAGGHRRRVLGAQCQLWTEYIETPSRAEYQYFPRVCAFAEVVWAPWGTTRHFADFEPRLGAHLRRLDALGVNYRPLAGPTPGQARIWPVPT
jgi:hexosaminidase